MYSLFLNLQQIKGCDNMFNLILIDIGGWLGIMLFLLLQCGVHFCFAVSSKIIDSVHAHDPSGMCVYLISLLGKRVLVNKTKMGCSKEEAATITLHYCTTPSLHRYTTSIPYNHTGNSQGAINSTLP